MTHEEEVFLAQLNTIARNCAANCDEQHTYMAGANKPDWHAHKWVIEAMLAVISIRNSEEADRLRHELNEAKKEIYTLTSLMRR